MAGPFTVDASVFLNAFNTHEPGQAVSRQFFDQLRVQAIPILAPTLLLPEVAAAVSRGRQNAQMAQQLATTLKQLPHLILIALDQRLADQAADIAAHYRLRGADAVYVAVAQRFGSGLVTLDLEQLGRVASLLTTQTPAAALVSLSA
jgi:predicted nucleic acid-binding protein